MCCVSYRRVVVFRGAESVEKAARKLHGESRANLSEKLSLNEYTLTSSVFILSKLSIKKGIVPQYCSNKGQETLCMILKNNTEYDIFFSVFLSFKF